jgi:hypothetical protein
MGVHFIGVYLMGVYLMGVYLMSVYLMEVITGDNSFRCVMRWAVQTTSFTSWAVESSSIPSSSMSMAETAE